MKKMQSSKQLNLSKLMSITFVIFISGCNNNLNYSQYIELPKNLYQSMVVKDPAPKETGIINFKTYAIARAKKGERVLQPNFGSGLQSLLFEPIDETFETRVADTITESVSQWLPYITIEDIFIDISDSNKDRNKVGVDIKFKVGETLDLQSVTFTLGT